MLIRSDGRQPPRTPLRVAMLTTRRAPGLSHLLGEDAGRGRLYQLVAGVASDPESEALPAFRRAGIPALAHDLRGFCASRGGKPGDLALRREYDADTVRFLGEHHPELIVLCGYLHIVTDRLLTEFPARVINLHDADLAAVDHTGRPLFRGLHSTFDALAAGQFETRSTVHLVSEEVDRGPPLVRSWGFPSHPLVADARRWRAMKMLKAYAYAQREWMMVAAWGPLLARAIQRFALDQVRLLDGRAVIAGRLGPEELCEGYSDLRCAAES
jgi:phosphoribosylglycinamide formyltransferase-1